MRAHETISGLPRYAIARYTIADATTALTRLPAGTRFITLQTFAKRFEPSLSYKQAWYFLDELAKRGLIWRVQAATYEMPTSEPTRITDEQSLLNTIAQTSARIRETEADLAAYIDRATQRLASDKTLLSNLRAQYMALAERKLAEALK